MRRLKTLWPQDSIEWLLYLMVAIVATTLTICGGIIADAKGWI